MTITKPISLTLEEFLKLPETKPASEYIDSAVIQKPMPKTRHSRLQGKLINVINEVTEANHIAYAFPELRCTFGDRSIVPDIAVFRWQNIELDEQEEPLDNILIAPDWTIEILSPAQSSNRVTGNILHCLKHGCQLGWLIDPGDRSVIVFQPGQQPELLHQEDHLLVLAGVELDLTAQQVFSWLKMPAQ
ncbi:MAG: Uma2 family endonuclease [Chloroflexaceae bacterium]|nr:Uma2 family endonuclease [Chloroflexaceae bacterium]